MRVASAVVLLLAGLRNAVAVSIDVENGVYKLQEATFDTVVKKFPAVMVKFYAPWCGHCKAMAPAYEKAAKKLRKAAEESSDPATHPRLAKVDATVEKDLAQKYEVQGFPTLVVFKDGEVLETYRGGRDKDDFINYMQTVSMPTPLGAIMRMYYVTLGVYKDIIRMTPLPGRYRKYAFTAFPAVLMSPVVLILLCVCLCGGKRSGAAEKRGRTSAKDEDKASAEEKEPAAGSSSGGGLQKRKGRSASPSGPSSSSAGKASGDDTKKEGEECEGDDKKED